MNRIGSLAQGLLHGATLAAMVGTAGIVQAADPGKGATLYGTHCAGCHGDRGEGVMPGVPDFSRGEAMMQPDRVLADSIIQGKSVMPAFQGMLSDDEVLDVIAYIRTMR